jgi:tRNA threonylcarbamoyl adenosine modification protein (Sua5/YciO/YrdC/YwlC family)
VTEPLVFEQPGPAGIAAAAEALDRGQLVVFPTDTVFGLAARPEMPEATAAVFEAKSRPRDLTLPVLVASVEMARSVAEVDERAISLAARFWPGALTLVLPRTDRSRGWDLGASSETIAVRVPDHEVPRQLLLRSGPLATTSANRSGRETPSTCDGVRAELGDSVAVFLCGGDRPQGRASTVVDLTSSDVRLLRRGALSPEQVRRALERKG